MSFNQNAGPIRRLLTSLRIIKSKKDDGVELSRYPRVIDILGAGAFGTVYLVKMSGENNELRALKAEFGPIDLREQIKTEAIIYNRLANEAGIPRFFEFIQHRMGRAILIDYLGPNLHDLWAHCEFKLSEKTTIMLGYQALSILELLHSNHFIHRDIKPSNFVLGRKQNSHLLYLIDFGLAKQFRTSDSLQHTYVRAFSGFVGTPRYASVGAHAGLPCRRKDDVECLGYVLLHLSTGSLPWAGFRIRKREAKYDFVVRKKNTVTVNQLCKDASPVLLNYMEYVTGLPPSECPDYEYLKNLFLLRMSQLNLAFDFDYDWCRKK